MSLPFKWEDPPESMKLLGPPAVIRLSSSSSEATRQPQPDREAHISHGDESPGCCLSKLLLEALGNPDYSEHEELREWAPDFDLAHFGLEEANTAMRASHD